MPTPLTGGDLPLLHTPIPGPRSQAFVDRLAAHECPAVTARRSRRAATLGTASDDPFVWDQALGSNVVDVDGNRFVDLTAGFAVALLGHRPPVVTAALHAQTDHLLHAMGDAWPDQARIRLLEALGALAPGDLSVSLLGLSGSDAVDAAIKTAVMATGRAGVLSFEGGYHGLALGVLGAQAYKPAFTQPFRAITHHHVQSLPWACPLAQVDRVLATGTVGLVLVEPVQGRGGMRPAPDGWLAELVAIAHRHGALVAFDEIQCGLGRTGRLHEGPAQGAVPDLLCLGKALGGGVPLSACLGTPQVMNAWGASVGEALHTQTFLGHPLACAAGLAVLDHLATHDLPAQAAACSQALTGRLEAAGYTWRGRGLMIGVHLPVPVFPVCRALQRRGYITLPAGQQAEVLALTPGITLTPAQMDGFVAALEAAVAEVRA